MNAKVLAWSRKTYAARIAKHLIYRARNRAKVGGLPFTISEKDITIPTHCPVLGIAIKVGDRSAGPSLDRHKPELGYVPGNVTVMSNRANVLKRDATPDEVFALAAYLKSKL